ncbi:hypothetical protein DEDE109153_07835 [Deinococcus deserti]|uniref:Uncharacterized protein n=1 Tax=Deinococcus deserti (strain DSM 17065 / CIP 109153 / LMG 22923 / VCD115) TaxID=546414 RepID=C1CWB2_DEIDV|nr:hypothetical protein [Deinococcus deserti]ACO46479.1 Hypothetical protein; putative membrane protein [Deinococcus deserti VCD115]
MTPEEWHQGVENEAVNAVDEPWSVETMRYLRRRQLVLSVLKLGTEFSLPLVFVVLMVPVLDRLATAELAFAHAWALGLTGALPSAESPFPLLEAGAWICVAAVWFMVGAIHGRHGLRLAVALTCLWLGGLPTWGFHRLTGLSTPLPDWWLWPAAAGLVWLWRSQQATTRQQAS